MPSASVEAEDAAEDEEHGDLHGDDAEDQRGDQAGLLAEQGKVDAGADRDEEQADQQALERLDVAFELVPVFAVGEHDAGQEGAERGRQADRLHQHRDADDEQQAEGGEQLAQPGRGDVAEDRPQRAAVRRG